MPGMTEINLYGQHLLLLPERALYWKQSKMLVVADLHFGKAQVFRAGGIPIPIGTTADNIDRLSSLFERFRPKELLVLGDLMHGWIDGSGAFNATVDKWRRRWSDIRLSLVTGNHDLRAGQPPAIFRLDRVVSQHVVKPFVFSHKPKPKSDEYAIAGHLHPAVSVSGKAFQKETLPCFCFGAKRALLPAFGGFTGSHVIRPRPQERVFVIADQEVIEIMP